MSSHFNYEINEPRLRERLRSMRAEPGDAEWESFNKQAQLQPGAVSGFSLPSFRFGISRSVLIPVVFGTVIAGFSFLLFNFVSIRKKPENAALKKEAPLTSRAPLPKAASIKTLALKPAPIVTVAPSPSVSAEVPVPEPAVASSAPEPKKEPQPNLNGSARAAVSGILFSSPNKASDKLGSFSAGDRFEPLEEAVYFIKVNHGGQTGYVMKSQLESAASQRTRKPRKAEVLPSGSATIFTSSEQKEPELR